MMMVIIKFAIYFAICCVAIELTNWIIKKEREEND